MTHQSDLRTEIAIAVVEHHDQFLVGQRATNVALPGLCEFPGGKVEAGETPEQAAVRECQEEAGLSVEVIAPYVVRDYDYEHAKLKLHFYACRPLDPSAILKGSFRWVRRERLSELEFPSANATLVKQLTAQTQRS
jgi:8-oxo-dGTP diphosphatase